LVTAVVSAYASERFMEGCLRDLVAQTLGERLEIIVVDTGSPEKEGEIVRRFMERHANIRYLRVEQRETVTQAYNRGARAARGKYVITTNTDDRLRPDALARLAQELDAHPEVGLVYADYFITNTENDEFYRHVRTGYSRKPDYHPNIMLDGCHMGPQPMWRRSLHEELGWFDEQMIAAGDYELWCRFAAKHPFRHVPEFLGLYLHNPAGVSNSNAARSASETARIWATYAGQFPPPPPGLPRGFFYREAVRPHRYVNIGMVTFNRLEFTRQVIETLVRHTNFPYVLTVVDNGSQDGTREYLMELRRQGIIRNLLLLEGNVGVTKAANLAWRQEPEAGYYLKLDNDILLQKAGWLKSMVEALEGVPQLGAVAYNFEPVSYSVVPMNNHRLRPKPEGYLGGACILIPKRTEQALGYWREECGLDGEADHDYCLRIRRQGGLIAYMEDEATGFHLPSGRAALIHPRTFEARDGQEETIHGEARRFKEDQQRQQVSSGKRDHFEADDLGGPRPLFQASASFWPGGTNLPAGNAPDALLPGPKVEGIALPCASVPGSMDGSRPVPPSPPPETAAVPAGKPAEKIPLFIITCNRLQCLQASIESYKQHIATPYEIVIHDNNSTYEPLLEYLRQLERDGVAVYRSATNVAAEEQLNLVANTVEHWFTTHAPSHYVVTDPDVALEGSCEDILQLYAYLLEGNPDIKVVGPMLRIDDIPDYYPLKQKVIASHTRQFWHKTPLNLCWKNKNVQYQLAPIDTTFGMYRRGFKFRRLCHGFRIYAPYWAKHLDWYINPATMSADQVYYLQHASGVSHWGGTWLRNSLSEQSGNGLPAQRQEDRSSLKGDILPVCSNA
jgi:GT2 family glycosyltransferase